MTVLPVTIRHDLPVSFICVRIPMETQLGIMEASGLAVSFEGRLLHLIDTPHSSSRVDAWDVQSGEVVSLDFGR